jgi:hypothetical protein
MQVSVPPSRLGSTGNNNLSLPTPGTFRMIPQHPPTRSQRRVVAPPGRRPDHFVHILSVNTLVSEISTDTGLIHDASPRLSTTANPTTNHVSTTSFDAGSVETEMTTPSTVLKIRPANDETMSRPRLLSSSTSSSASSSPAPSPTSFSVVPTLVEEQNIEQRSSSSSNNNNIHPYSHHEHQKNPSQSHHHPSQVSPLEVVAGDVVVVKQRSTNKRTLFYLMLSLVILLAIVIPVVVLREKTPPDIDEVEVEVGTCGNGVRGNGICTDKDLCCSIHGWCGSSMAHCSDDEDQVGADAAPTYMTWTAGPASAPTTTIGDLALGEVGACIDGVCSNRNHCCSTHGYCGTGPEYCAGG